MKKLRLFIISILLSIPMVVFATGSASVSPSKLTITEGQTKTFSIKLSNAAGRVDLSSSNTGVAAISKSSTFIDNTSENITVTAKSVGTATITVTFTDVSTYDYEGITGSKTVTIEVVPKTTTTKPSTTKSTTKKTSKKTTTKSKNKTTTTKKGETTTTTITTTVEKKSLLQIATEFVETAEKSLSPVDYSVALKTVSSLDSGKEKEELTKRLDDIKNFLVEDEKMCEKCNYQKWFILCGALLLFILAENIIILCKKNKDMPRKKRK